jgi:hypothetical protein
VSSPRRVLTHRSAYVLDRGRRGGVLIASMPAAVRIGSNALVSWPLRSRMGNAEPVGVVAEVGREVAGRLRGLRPVGIGRGAEHVNVAGADLDHDEHMHPLEGERAPRRAVAGRDRVRLGARELPPRGLRPLRRRWDTPAAQQPSDRGAADAMSEVAHLALDPHVAPGRVLDREGVRSDRPVRRRRGVGHGGAGGSTSSRPADGARSARSPGSPAAGPATAWAAAGSTPRGRHGRARTTVASDAAGAGSRPHGAG